MAARRKLNAVTLFVFCWVLTVEIYTYVLPVMLAYIQPKRTAFITFAVTTIPRCLFWLLCSFYFGGKSDWWKKYFTVDGMLPITTAVCITYGFLLMYSTDVEPEGWKIAAVVALPFLLMTLNGHVRVLVKYFPWNRWTLLVYRLNRVLAVTITIIVELLAAMEAENNTAASSNTSTAKFNALNPCVTPYPNCTTIDAAFAPADKDEALNSRFNIVFIALIIPYYCTLFALIPKWEAVKRARNAAEKK